MKWFVFMAVGLALLAVAPELSAQLAMQTPFEHDVTIQAERKRSSRLGGGDWDDKTDRITFTVKFTNTHRTTGYTGAKADFYVFGNSTQDRRAYQLLGTHHADVSVPALGSTEFTTAEMTSKYDTTGVKFGSKYDSWVLLVRDSTGKVLAKKTSSAGWLPVAESLDTLTVNKFYSRDLKENTNVR